MKIQCKLNLIFYVILVFFITQQSFSQYNLAASSHLGGSANNDRVYGSEILNDGTIVLAANISNASFNGITINNLNGATSSSSGAIIRLSPDGKKVLSVTRISDHVSDLSIDSSERLYVAAGEGGAVVLNKTASTVLKKISYTNRVHRIDATPSGRFVSLVSNNPYDNKALRGGTVYVYDNNWNEIKNWSAGMQYTTDVCMDQNTKTVVALGFKNINASDDSNGGNGRNPVDVSIYKGWNYSGTQKYRGYDWNGTRNDPRWINAPRNNMADSRGARCTIGDDGKLYMSFGVDGGNHIFRYSPFNVRESVSIVQGDKYHRFNNTRTEKKTFFGRYDVATGAYLRGQQFCARLSSGAGNTAHPELGDIKADANGNVYVVGASAAGLPLTFDPQPGAYNGGAFVLVMDADFKRRKLSTRLAAFSAGHSISFKGDKIVIGGYVPSNGVLFTKNAVDNTANGGDGFFSLLSGGVIDTNNPPSVSISSPSSGSSYNEGDTINIKAIATDSDGTIAKVEFFRGTTKLGEDTTSPYSYSWNNVREGNYTLTAVATDNKGITKTSSAITISVEGTIVVAEGYFVETAGLLSIEAENFDALKAGTGNASSVTLEPYSDTKASNGKGLRSTSNTGINTGNNTNGPRADYNVYFNTPGTYNIWLRVIGPTPQDDSWHVGLDGRLLSGGGYGMGGVINNWTWVDDVPSTGAKVTVTIDTPGSHTINIWMREDGTLLDKLVFTKGGAPTGIGPTESVREENKELEFINILRNYKQLKLNTGVKYYSDRDYEVTSIELPELENQPFIQTANDDKLNTSANDYLCFDIEVKADIYVAYDSRATGLPLWLQDGWVPISKKINVSEVMRFFKLYKKTYTPGTICLGGNLASGATDVETNYIVTGILTSEETQEQYSLVVTNGSGDGAYDQGTIVVIKADPAPSGKMFDKWIGDTGNIANTNDANTTFTTGTANASITATYKNIDNPTGPLTSSLTVANGKNYEWFTLSNESKMYIDRNYKFKNISSVFNGSQTLRTANNDKGSNASADLISFKANRDLIVYVAYTTINTTLASQWLTSANGWNTESSTISSDLNGNEATRYVKSKSFSAGVTVKLKGNGGTSANTSMYNVIVKEASSRATLVAETTSKELNIKTYPNPVLSNLTVEVSEQTRGVIYTLQGLPVQSFDLKASAFNTIDMKELDAGLYILQIGNSKIRIIKQ